MFSDPTAMGLLGLAQGFGQAAMPSRMPVPMGAAIGMGAAGLGQGAGAAQAYQRAQLQNQQAQMQNDLAQAALPARKAMMERALIGMGVGGGQSGASSPSPSGWSGGQSTGGNAPSSGGAPGNAGAGGAQPGFGGGMGQGAPGGSSVSFGPNEVLNQAYLAYGSGDTNAFARLMGTYQHMIKEGYGTDTSGNVVNLPGSNQALYNRKYAETHGALPADIARMGAQAQTNVWQRGQELPLNVDEARQKGINAANTNLQESYLTPRDLGNGTTGTYGQVLGPAPALGAGGAVPSDPFPQIAQRIQSYENGTGNPAARNPNSSATGNGQFIDDTWRNMVRTVRPDIASSLSDSQILSLRSNPELSSQMTEQYARQNGNFLLNKGIPPTPDNVYLAHRFGPQGALSILTKTPETPMAMAVGADAVRANPDIQGKTVGDIVGMARQRMAPQPQQVAPGINRITNPNGTVTTLNTRDIMGKDLERDMKVAQEAGDTIEHANAQQTRLLHMRDIAEKLPTGSLGETRGAIANFVETFMPSIAGTWSQRAASIPDAKLSQEFAKLALTSAGEQERGVLGGRGGFRAIEMYQKANPSLELQPSANRDILNMQLIAQQADVDYAHGLQQWVDEKGQAFRTGRGDYEPSVGFDRQWTGQRNPQVYASAIDALNGTPFQKWSKGLTKDEGLRALQVISRVDPNAQVMGDDGKMWPVTRFMPQASAQ
jgi:hypothetical protein